MTTFDLLTMLGFSNDEVLTVGKVLDKTPASDYAEGFSSWVWAYHKFGRGDGNFVKIYAASLMHSVIACGWCAGCSGGQAVKCMKSLVDAIDAALVKNILGEHADVLYSRYIAEAVLIDAFNEITATV